MLDETDKMFEMGFVDDVEEIIRHIPQQRQLLMFSATISEDVHRLARKHLKNPVIIKTQSYVDHSKLKQIYYDIYRAEPEVLSSRSFTEQQYRWVIHCVLWDTQRI